MGLYVLVEQPAVEIYRPGAQARPLRDPGGRVIGELDLPAFGIGPLPGVYLCLDQHERPVSVSPALVRFRARANPPVRPRIADLVAAGLTLADVAETAMPIPVGHNAAPFVPC